METFKKYQNFNEKIRNLKKIQNSKMGLNFQEKY